MDAVAGPGVSELGEGIVDVVVSLRGAASASLAVAGYDRYVGCTDIVEGDLMVEAPEGRWEPRFSRTSSMRRWSVGAGGQHFRGRTSRGGS